MSNAIYTDIKVAGETWAFQRCASGIEVYEPDGHEQFWIPGADHSPELIEAIANTFAKGMRIGIEIGKDRKAHEIRQAIGAAAQA